MNLNDLCITYLLQLSVKKKHPAITMVNVVMMVNAFVMMITTDMIVAVSIIL